MAYTAITGKAFREKKGSLSEKLGTEFAAIEVGTKVVSATITDGNTSVEVTHGLATTPEFVGVMPADVQGMNWYVTTIGATTFTLNTQAAVIGTASFKCLVR